MKAIQWMACCLIFLGMACQKNIGPENPDTISPLTTGSWRLFLFMYEGFDRSASFSSAVYKFGTDGSLTIEQLGVTETGKYKMRSRDNKSFMLIEMNDSPTISLLNKDWEVLEISPDRIRMQNTVSNKTSLLTLLR